jgi:hypothetical protein
MAKKSLYLFLTSLLGVMLFLVLDRSIVFFYLYMLAGGYITTSFDYYQFLAVDYFTLTIVLMLGAWYGIWLGLYWYERVYEKGSYYGFVHHLASKYWPGPKPESLSDKMSAVRQHLEEDLFELNTLADNNLEPKIDQPPIKRRIVRKRAPKKLNSIK